MRLWSDHGDPRPANRLGTWARDLATSKRGRFTFAIAGVVIAAGALASTGRLSGTQDIARDCSLSRYSWLPECQAQAEQRRTNPAPRAKVAQAKPEAVPAEAPKPVAAAAEPAKAVLPKAEPVIAAQASAASDNSAPQPAASPEGATRIAVWPDPVPAITLAPAPPAASEPQAAPRRVAKPKTKRQDAPRAAETPSQRYAEFRDPLTGRIYRDDRVMRDSGWGSSLR